MVPLMCFEAIWPGEQGNLDSFNLQISVGFYGQFHGLNLN